MSMSFDSTSVRVRRSMMPAIKWIAVFSFASNVLMLAVPIHMMQVYDRVLSSGSVATLFYISLITIVALMVYSVSEMLKDRLAQRLSANFMTVYAEDVFKELVKNTDPLVDETQAIRDLHTVRIFLAGRQYVGLFDLPFFPLFMLLMFMLHFTLGLVALCGVCAMIGVGYLNKKMTDSASEESMKATGEATAFSQSVMRRIDDIRAMGLLPSIMQRWGQKTANSLQLADAATQHSSMFYGISKFVRQSLQISVMAWGAYLVLGGDISGGMIFASSMLLGRALQPIEQVIGAWATITHARAAFETISKLTAQSELRKEPTALPDPQGHMKVQNLTYAPGAAPDSKAIVDDVSFSLVPGTVLAVVGPSGAGKSTLARLMVSAILPNSGEITLDGFPLDQWSDWQRGQAIGYVPQDIVLFPGTIAENIARLELNPDDEKVVHAAQQAGVHDMIGGLEAGYATQIGPNGTTLSGGQRQRIALARAYYTSPKVLVLDEPNAHLDQYGEKNLMASLVSAKNDGMAVLVVSQRRSILKIADYVMTMVNGKVHSIARNPALDEDMNGANASDGQVAPIEPTALPPTMTSPPMQTPEPGGNNSGSRPVLADQSNEGMNAGKINPNQRAG